MPTERQSIPSVSPFPTASWYDIRNVRDHCRSSLLCNYYCCHLEMGHRTDRNQRRHRPRLEISAVKMSDGGRLHLPIGSLLS